MTTLGNVGFSGYQILSSDMESSENVNLQGGIIKSANVKDGNFFDFTLPIETPNAVIYANGFISRAQSLSGMQAVYTGNLAKTMITFVGESSKSSDIGSALSDILVLVVGY